MKPTVIIFFLFYFFTSYSCFAALTNEHRLLVVIDPGHGGSDTGAKQDSFIESRIVLKIAEKIQNYFAENPFLGVDIEMTRSEDHILSLQQRVDYANEKKADLFVSLHANWSNSKQVSGFEFYFSSQNTNPSTGISNLNSSTTNKNEDSIIKKIKTDLALLSKQKQSLEFTKQTQKLSTTQKSVIRRAPFYVIERTLMPAVLIEVGFISNKREAKKLASTEYQNELAQLLAESIKRYKEKSDKKVSLNEN